MKRIYHVISCPEGGSTRDEVLHGSYDRYEEAKPVAQDVYNRADIGRTVLIRCQGTPVWGPYTKGKLV